MDQRYSGQSLEELKKHCHSFPQLPVKVLYFLYTLHLYTHFIFSHTSGGDVEYIKKINVLFSK